MRFLFALVLLLLAAAAALSAWNGDWLQAGLLAGLAVGLPTLERATRWEERP